MISTNPFFSLKTQRWCESDCYFVFCFKAMRSNLRFLNLPVISEYLAVQAKVVVLTGAVCLLLSSILTGKEFEYLTQSLIFGALNEIFKFNLRLLYKKNLIISFSNGLNYKQTPQKVPFFLRIKNKVKKTYQESARYTK